MLLLKNVMNCNRNASEIKYNIQYNMPNLYNHRNVQDQMFQKSVSLFNGKFLKGGIVKVGQPGQAYHKQCNMHIATTIVM